MKTFLACVVMIGAAMLSSSPVMAEPGTIRWAGAGDSLTLDPHAQNEGPTHTLSHQIYEPLLQRDMEAKIIPALATSWHVKEGQPNVWVFRLREGVKFHEGQDFDADDVVFSLKRSMLPDSDMKELLASVTDIRKTGEFEVEIETVGPTPLLPNNLTNTFIMDEGWAKEHGVENPQGFDSGETTYAVTHANGTGAFRLVSRDPDVKTELQRNEQYWGRDAFPMQVSEIVFTPIQNPATRVAALLSGEVDFIQDVPVQDLARVADAPDLRVSNAPENRSIFLGLNVGDSDLVSDNIDGKNPFADPSVREAMDIVLNRDAIGQVVMRGQSQPAGIIMSPFINGWTEELNAYPEVDIDKAKALMAAAGYGDGFEVVLNCPNNRYINDEAICQAAVGMFGQIGIKVNLVAQPKSIFFPLISGKQTDFYMLGWGVPTFDSEHIFDYLIHSTTDKLGTWNGTRFSDPEIDAKIESLATDTDVEGRARTVAEIWARVKAERIYLPIHNQILNWGMRKNIDFDVQPDNQPHFKFLTFGP